MNRPVLYLTPAAARLAFVVRETFGGPCGGEELLQAVAADVVRELADLIATEPELVTWADAGGATVLMGMDGAVALATRVARVLVRRLDPEEYYEGPQDLMTAAGEIAEAVMFAPDPCLELETAFDRSFSSFVVVREGSE